MNKRHGDTKNAEKKRQKLPPWLKHLKTEGWAVIPSVLPSDKTEEYKSRFWDWMESFGSGLKRDDRSTWKGENWPLSIRGLLQHYRIGHSKFVWDLRVEEAVLEIFSLLWGTDDLLVSFDGACLAKPSHTETTMQKDSWAHLDQGPKKAGQYECVQGLMTLSEAGPGLGGLVVYSKSHKLHKEFYEQFPKLAKKTGNSDWCKFNVKHRLWYFDHGAEEVQPAGPPGSVILWDSRTVHWAARPSKGQTHCRMAIYLCYVPRNKSTRRDLEKKRKAFEERRMTSHWPAQSKLFPKYPRTWGKEGVLEKFTDRPAITNEEVTKQMCKLIGY